MRNTILLFLLLGSIGFPHLHSQIFNNASSYGGGFRSGAYAYDLVVDPLGNTIFCGRFHDSLTIDNFQFVYEGQSDAYIGKRNTEGELVWAYAFGGKGIDNAYHLATDNLGNIYLSGDVYDSAMVFGRPIFSTNPGSISASSVGYVLKLSPTGDVLWLNTYQPELSMPVGVVSAGDITIGQAGGVYIQGTVRNNAHFDSLQITTDHNHAFLAKLSSATGDFDWVKSFRSDGSKKQLVMDDQGNLYSLINFFKDIQPNGTPINPFNPNITSGEYLLIKWDSSGNYLWSKHLYTDFTPQSGFSDLRINHIESCGQSGVALGGTFLGSLFIDGQPLGVDVGRKPNGFVARFDGVGNTLWAHSWIGPASLVGLTSNSSGEVLISGYPGPATDSIQFGGGLTLDLDRTTQKVNNFFIKYSLTGEAQWSSTLYGRTNTGNRLIMNHLQFGQGDNIHVFGETNWDSVMVGNDTLLLNGGSDIIFIEMADTLKSPLPPPNKILGTIYRDDNLNCIDDPGEAPLSQIIVQAIPGPYLGISDSAGNYEIPVPAGSYSLSQVIPNIPGLLMETVCPPGGNYQAIFGGSGQSQPGYDFGDTLTHCPYLEVHLTGRRKRFCSNSASWIRYINRGTDTAYNAYLILEYDSNLVPTGASRPWQFIDSSHWRIELGDIAPDSTGVVTIDEFATCEFLANGLSPCLRVEIFPSNRCSIPDLNWSRAELSLESQCLLRDTVQFNISNTGSGNMTDSSEWNLYLDAVLVDKGKVKLDSGQIMALIVPTSGKTAYLRIDQVPFYPDETWLSAVEEACGLGDTLVSKGFVSQFPLVDWRKRTEKAYCLPIVNSFDPNDKQATPSGITAANIIPPETRISYQIRFQNTGTDTAFKVVIRDTLPESLDLSTFQLTGASHAYQYTLEGGSPAVLVFTFDPIMLPDSNVNEEASHGFVNFACNVNPTLPLGTILENRAAIYFDFNPPVITNTVLHTVDTLQPSLIDKSLVESFGPIDMARAMEDAVMCQADSFQISAIAPKVGDGYWNLLQGAGYISNPDWAHTWLIAEDTGIFTLSWQVSKGALISKDLVKIKISKLPKQPVIIENKQNLQVETEADYVQWFLDGVPISDTSKTLVPQVAGSYTAQAYNDASCPSAISLAVNWNSKGVQPLRIYPNPTEGLFEVILPEREGPSQLILYGLNGEEVWKSTSLDMGLPGKVEVQLKTLPAGVYYLQLHPQNFGTLIQLQQP